MKHYIYGAGGHGKVVLDAMQLTGLDCHGFVDDNNASIWVGLSVNTLSKLQVNDELSLHLAIGSGNVREAIANQLAEVNFFSVYIRMLPLPNRQKLAKGH